MDEKRDRNGDFEDELKDLRDSEEVQRAREEDNEMYDDDISSEFARIREGYSSPEEQREDEARAAKEYYASERCEEGCTCNQMDEDEMRAIFSILSDVYPTDMTMKELVGSLMDRIILHADSISKLGKLGETLKHSEAGYAVAEAILVLTDEMSAVSSAYRKITDL